jgi:putative ABC transport system permease protein
VNFVVLKYAFRNILRTRLRSVFTIFSITLLIILYTVLTTVGDSFASQIKKVLNQQNIDIAIQSRYAATPMTSSIDMALIKPIMQMQEIASYDALLIGRKRIERNALIFMLGVSNFDSIAQRLGLKIIEGRSLKKETHEIVIGQKMANLHHLSVGATLQLNSTQEYRIVGIYTSWLNFLNAGVMADLHDTQILVGKKEKINLLFLRLKESAKTQQIVIKINQQFKELRAIDSSELPNYIGPVKTVFYFSKIVSLLTLVIAIAVLLNTFILSISERTKEIGILRAIGWSPGVIMRVFLFESLILSFSGGFFGYLLSYPVIYLLQYNYLSIAMYLPTAPSIAILGNVIIMCFLIALFSIVFPAFYGTRIHIAKAIRHE